MLPIEGRMFLAELPPSQEVRTSEDGCVLDDIHHRFDGEVGQVGEQPDRLVPVVGVVRLLPDPRSYRVNGIEIHST